MGKLPKLNGRALLESMGNPSLLENQPRQYWNDLCNTNPDKSIKNKLYKAMFGKSRHIRLREDSASLFFQLSKALGYDNCDGNTISWLMNQAQPAIQAAIGGITTSTSSSFSDLDEIKRGKNRIWAVCDEEVDGMPRLYCKMGDLLLDELKAEVTVLEPEISTENSLPIACGRFKECSLVTAMEISEFWYPVNCVEERLCDDGRVCYNIFPRKDEVWVVFRDWNVNWTLHDYMKCKVFEIVEVVLDLCEESGIGTVCLGRAGDVFERKKSNGKIIRRSFVKSELLQFSHRVPASKLKKEESSGGDPSQSWKLDCAALPLNLL